MTALEFLADALMLAHAAFSLFVVLGLVAILMGGPLGWQWTGNRTFRVLHLAATLFVVARVWIGVPCPFSTGEDALRRQNTTRCPLGELFHEVMHRCAFRGAEVQRFALSSNIVGLVAVVAFRANNRASSSGNGVRNILSRDRNKVVT